MDFIGEIDYFITNINEALNSLASGLELRNPDPQIFQLIDAKTHRTNIPAGAIDHLEQLLEEWCNQIERFLEAPTQGRNTEDIGPKGELEYWRSRMQKLTSVTEQLKR